LSENAKYFFVLGLYVDSFASVPILPTFFSTVCTIGAWLITWSS
jgi:hypothetical protein